MTSKQWLKIKSSIININNHLSGIFLSFNSLNKESFPRSRLIDIFSSCFLFYKADHKKEESKAAYYCKLDEIVLNTSLNPNKVIIISNTGIRNNVTTSIAHVTILSERHFVMLLMLSQQQPNYLLLDMELAKYYDLKSFE